ncbi:DEP domain-containing protein 5 [Hypsibius exemplaris]|uniref:DEP domain-containing protein 5 n=1 Tax=Hypsibius exemplaris TaxID=2072580 RepID=A0A1W0WIT3_HYPEX|nr:DEP domain-containing protein 5 [Hypsibius exemplaris]
MYHGGAKDKRSHNYTSALGTAPDAWLNLLEKESSSKTTGELQLHKMKQVGLQLHTTAMRAMKQQPAGTVPGEDSKETDDLHLNPKDFPELKVGDIIEIYHVEDEFSRLLLQVRSGHFKETLHNTISVEDTIARTFQLRQYQNVIVNQVSFKDVELNHVELTFKDQYFSRSDMWRYRNALVGTCAYLHKKIEYGFGRTTVHEMWSKGTRVASGTIGENTKIVYRSMTSNVYIFIQMSVEMWEFDHYGDLYFEKSIKGFLTDLFKRWQKQQANHDVTIVMFSRTFYEAEDISEFPCAMQEGILQDYKGRFYEDFYRIVIQNEKYEDWTLTLIKLKTIFHQYKDTVLNFHSHPGVKLPRAYNSTAAEGNVLEVLNMSLNVFEKHTVDRNFERTGQMCVVITPSTGVFEVDRELLTLTKQKSIDYGIGNDLVFMGEQPLHVVPLFILHNKRSWNKPGEEPADYAIPNWLNYSYYTSKDVNPNVFVPRIRIPEEVLLALQNKTQLPDSSKAKGVMAAATTPQQRCVTDGTSTWKAVAKKARLGTRAERRVSESNAAVTPSEELPEDGTMYDSAETRSHMLLSSSLETANPLRPNARPLDNLKIDQLCDQKRKNTKSPNARHQRSLINPLAPSKIPVKLTSNRRRWVDIFPQDTSGAAVQTHHFRGASHSEDAQELSRSPLSDTPKDTDSLHVKPKRIDENDRVSSWVNNTEVDDASTIDEEVNMPESMKSPRRIRNNRGGVVEMGRGSPAPSGSLLWKFEAQNKAKTKKSYVWGITGEMEWTPNLTTGVDWKALTMPASLPITTDYLPDRRTLQNDYLVSNYSMMPDQDPGGDAANNMRVEGLEGHRYYSRPLRLRELYDELICQRLQHGFQLITGSKIALDADLHVAGSGKLIYGRKPNNEVTYLSLGRVIHMLTLEQTTVTVKRFSPRHAYEIPSPHYKYRFMVPDNPSYEVSHVLFSHERLENFNWNYNDFRVLSKGRGEFKLEHPMKYWKGQYYLLPSSQEVVQKISKEAAEKSAKAERETSQISVRCDIFTEKTSEDCDKLCDGFMRIMETCNRMKRPARNRKSVTSSVKKSSVPNKPLHRGANPAAVSTPDLQGGALVMSPKTDYLSQHYSELDIVKTAHGMGLDLGSLDGLGSPRSSSGLNLLSPLTDILDAMKLPAEGIVTYQKQADLQTGYFIGYEAVDWALETMKLYCSELVVAIFNRMIAEHLIVHASGNPAHPFICGFYLYNIVPGDGKPHAVAAELSSVSADVDFDQVWLESAIINPYKGLARPRGQASVPEFLKPEPRFEKVEFACDKTPYYALATKKACLIDVDLYHKSDRLEWAIANYHTTFTPNLAFEIELKWIQASGLMFGDLIQALKSTDGRPMFADFPPESVHLRLVLFQEMILKQFGFIPLQENVHKTDVIRQAREFVSVTGGMFAMIPPRDKTEEPVKLIPKADPAVNHLHRDESSYCGDGAETKEIGFYWAWNSCLTKKWRSPHTGDEDFLDVILLDFRRFCSNTDNRLLQFWNAACSKPSHSLDLTTAK